MIRLRYTYLNVNNQVAWGDAFMASSYIDEALESFAKIKTAFLLSRLETIKAFDVATSDIVAQEFEILNASETISDFIADHSYTHF